MLVGKVTPKEDQSRSDLSFISPLKDTTLNRKWTRLAAAVEVRYVRWADEGVRS